MKKFILVSLLILSSQLVFADEFDCKEYKMTCRIWETNQNETVKFKSTTSLPYWPKYLPELKDSKCIAEAYFSFRASDYKQKHTLQIFAGDEYVVADSKAIDILTGHIETFENAFPYLVGKRFRVDGASCIINR